MPTDDDEFLSSETLEKVHIEVIEHMKRAGTFDEIHVKLMNPLQNDERYLEIVRRFETECEKFCRGEDLTKPRNYLRAKLTDRFNKSRDDQLQLDAYVKKYLRSQDNDLRQIYGQHAEEFLRKFIPIEEIPFERSPTPPKASPPTPPRKSPIEDSSLPRRTPSPQTRSEDMEIDSEDEIEKPVFSPIGMGSSPSPKTDLRIEETIKENYFKKEETVGQECDNNDVKQPPNDHHHQNNHHDIMKTDDQNELNNTNHNRNNADDPTPVCDGDDDDDANLDLDLDDVSSVKTADLANFDDLIEISDDEADLLNVEKKAKIPVKTLAGDIEDLKQTHTTTITVSNIVDPSDVPIPPMDPPPASESSDSNNLSRTPRNRKSNPRYNNEDFRLL